MKQGGLTKEACYRGNMAKKNGIHYALEKLGTSPLNRRRDAQATQESDTKEIELHRKTETHLSRYYYTLPPFSQCAMVKTFDKWNLFHSLLLIQLRKL
jgi:hypothetical protein